MESTKAPNPYFIVIKLFVAAALAAALALLLMLFDVISEDITYNFIALFAIVGIFIAIVAIIAQQYKHNGSKKE